MAGVMILMPFYLEMVKHIRLTTPDNLLALPIGMILTSPMPANFRRHRD